jgi:hypothetical protein
VFVSKRRYTTARNRAQVGIGTPTRQHEPSATVITSHAARTLAVVPEQPSKPFERRWSAEQQQALAHAMVDATPRLKAPQAQQAALNGTLPGAGGQLEPFGPVPMSTLHTIRRREIEGRKVRAQGRLAKAENSATAAKIVLADAWSELDKAREQVRRAKMSGVERAKAQREIVTTAATIVRLEREITGEAPSKSSKGEGATEQPAKRQRTEADDLARAARARAQTEQRGLTDTQRAAAQQTTPQTQGSTDHATDSREHAQAIDRAQLASSLA